MIPHEGEMVSVDVDNQKGALLAMEHLVVTLGHRRIGFIGKPNLASSVERLNGYRTVLEKNQIPVDEELIHIADIATISGGASATDLLLNLPDPPTAIFAVNDMIAIGAIRAAQEHGLKVPQDFSVIGFDDIPLSECINPALTTIRQPAYEKGVWAARLIIEYIETKMKPLSQILDCELIVRGSTAPARG
jgi:DNA-binding LacI/PurR family transcriptional regulator